MKTYVAPNITFVELRVEERLAGSVCHKPGTCENSFSTDLSKPPPICRL